MQRPWRRPCAPLGISKPALTWVVSASGRHHHCERLWLSSGPGSHPDRGLGGVCGRLAEGGDGCCSSHRVTPCAPGGLRFSDMHAAITECGARASQPETPSWTKKRHLGARDRPRCRSRGVEQTGDLPELWHVPALSSLGLSGILGHYDAVQDCPSLLTCTTDTFGSYASIAV